MKLFTIGGGFLGFMYCFYGIVNMYFMYDSFISLLTQLFKIDGFFGYVLGMFIAALTLLIAFKPDDPFPWHWLLLLLFSILLMIFCHIIAGIPVLIAGVIGLFNDV
ncbi:hypothetical protein ES705_38064 [subsurface metagenome]